MVAGCPKANAVRRRRLVPHSILGCASIGPARSARARARALELRRACTIHLKLTKAFLIGWILVRKLIVQAGWYAAAFDCNFNLRFCRTRRGKNLC